MRGEGCLVKELTFDGDDASGLGRDLSECTDRKVHAVRVLAGRASVRDGDRYALAVIGVNDLHLLAAERGLHASVTVARNVCRGYALVAGISAKLRENLPIAATTSLSACT